MISKIKNILIIYFRNPAYYLAFLIFIFSAIASRILLRTNKYLYAEDFFNLMFIVACWLAFEMGIIAKRNFSTYRSRLTPNYKYVHLSMVIINYLLCIFVAYLWQRNLVPAFFVPSHAIIGSYLCCILISLIIIYLGYLSIIKIIIFFYIIILLVASQAGLILEFLIANPQINKYLIIWIVFISIFLILRLLKLKEGEFEYNFLLSWPPKNLIENQTNILEKLPLVGNIVETLNKNNCKIINIKKYHSKKSIFERSYHLDILENKEIINLIILSLITLPIFIIIGIKFKILEILISEIYANYLLFISAPALIIIFSNYKKLPYLYYEKLKPIKLNDYINQRILSAFSKLFIFWLIIIIYFAIAPLGIIDITKMKNIKFWLFILSTSIGSFASLSILMYLSLKEKFSLYTLTYFFLFCAFQIVIKSCEEYLTMSLILINIFICIAIFANSLNRFIKTFTNLRL